MKGHGSCIHTCMYIYIYVYLHSYTHTCIHAQVEAAEEDPDKGRADLGDEIMGVGPLDKDNEDDVIMKVCMYVCYVCVHLCVWLVCVCVCVYSEHTLFSLVVFMYVCILRPWV
jgi:hypothetical protein